MTKRYSNEKFEQLKISSKDFNHGEDLNCGPLEGAHQKDYAEINVTKLVKQHRGMQAAQQPKIAR